MIIRRMQGADAAAFRDLRLRALQTNPEAFSAAYEDELTLTSDDFLERIPAPDSEDAIFVAEVDGQLVGMAGFVREKGRKREHKAVIWGVYVDEGYRGRGFSRALFDALFKHAGQLRGLRQITLSVVTVNAAAIHLYEAFGFVRWGTESDGVHVGNRYYDQYHMVHFLPRKR